LLSSGCENNPGTIIIRQILTRNIIFIPLTVNPDYISLYCYIDFCLEFFKRRIFLAGWYSTYSSLLPHLRSLTCMCLVQRLLRQ
jgi:hypothetical protein